MIQKPWMGTLHCTGIEVEDRTDSTNKLNNRPFLEPPFLKTSKASRIPFAVVPTSVSIFFNRGFYSKLGQPEFG